MLYDLPLGFSNDTLAVVGLRSDAGIGWALLHGSKMLHWDGWYSAPAAVTDPTLRQAYDEAVGATGSDEWSARRANAANLGRFGQVGPILADGRLDPVNLVDRVKNRKATNAKPDAVWAVAQVMFVCVLGSPEELELLASLGRPSGT